MGDGRVAKTVLCVAKIVCVSVPQKWRSGADKKVFCSTDPPCAALLVTSWTRGRESWGAPALAGPALGGPAQLSLLSFFAHSVLPPLTMILLWHCGGPVVDLWWPQLALIVLQIQAPPLLNLLSRPEQLRNCVMIASMIAGLLIAGLWDQHGGQKSTFMEKFEPPLNLLTNVFIMATPISSSKIPMISPLWLNEH